MARVCGCEQGRDLLGARGAAVLPRGEPAVVHRVPDIRQLRGGVSGLWLT